MTKKICISGYYGFDNFGDETILKILVENLKKFENCPDITVFSSNPLKTTEQLQVNSVQTFDIKSVVFALLKSDCLISGGGSLLQDKTSIKSLIYYLFVIFTAQLFCKKTIIFAQGIGPIQNKLWAKITFMILKHCNYITVRDDNSLNLLSEHNIKAEKCSDPVWNINLENSKKAGKIGIQLRDFSDITEEFLNQLAFCVNKYYQDKDINLLSLQNKIDMEISKKFEQKLRQINPNINIKIIENTSNDKIIQDISELETLIAMRYHACLIAIKAGVKLLPVNYDIKVETIAKDFDLKYINLKDDIAPVFEQFVSSAISYDTEKINSLKYDFKKLETMICQKN